MEAELVAYEDSVLPLEVHLLEFPSDAALDAYMHDPERTKLTEARDRAIARTAVYRVDLV